MTGFKNYSIKSKLIIIQTSTAFIVVLVCCIFFVLNDIRTFKDSAKRKMYSLARIVGENATSTLVFLDQDAATRILTKLNKEPDIVQATVLDKNGNLFADYTKHQPVSNSTPIVHNTPATSEFEGRRLMVSYRL